MPCYTLFTTHFRELAALPKLYPNVKIFSIVADASFRSTFQLTEGTAISAGYGLRAGAAAGLPPSVLERAEGIKVAMHGHAKNAVNTGDGAERVYRAAERVMALHSSSLDDEGIGDILRDMKLKLGQ